MTGITLHGIAPADPDHDTFPSAVAWLRAHFRASPREMVPTIQGLLDSVSIAEHRADIATADAAGARCDVLNLEARLRMAEGHCVRLRGQVAELKSQLIEGEENAASSR